jgi:hypothetical protein
VKFNTIVGHVKSEWFSSISGTLEIYSVFIQLSGQIGVISDLVAVRNLIYGVTVISKFIVCEVCAVVLMPIQALWGIL